MVREMNITAEQLAEIIKDAVSRILVESKEPKLTLTIAEAASMSGIGRDKITELTFKNGFPCFKVGSKTLINREKFIEWLNEISEHKAVI
jgi:excisionase family DNA binding protein